MELAKALNSLDALSVHFESIREKETEFQETHGGKPSIWTPHAEKWAAIARNKLEIQAVALEEEGALYEEPKEFRLVRTLDESFNLIQERSIERLFSMCLTSVDELLLESSEVFGVDMFSKQYAGQALIDAVSLSLLDVINLFLQDKRINIAELCPDLLFAATEIANLEALDVLLQDDRIDPSSNNYESLKYALSSGYADVVDRFLYYKIKTADVLRTIPNCFDHAIRNYHVKLVQKLIQTNFWNLEEHRNLLKLAYRVKDDCEEYYVFRDSHEDRLRKIESIIFLLKEKIDE